MGPSQPGFPHPAPPMLRFVRFLRTASLAALGLLAAAGAFAAAPAGALAFSIDLPPGRAPAEISGTIVAVSSARTWTIKEKSDDTIVIHLVHRKVEATVTYLFSSDKIVAYCEAYEVDSKGKRGKPEQPTRWLKYLQEDLRRLLVTAPIPAVARASAPAPKPAAAAKSPALAVANEAAKKDAPPLQPPLAPAALPTAALPPPTTPPPAPVSEGVQLVQFPPEAVSPLSYYARVYLLVPPGLTEGRSAPRIFDETPGTQGGGPGRAIEIGTVESERALGWNRPAGVLSLRADTGTPATPRLALELAPGKAYYVLLERNGARLAFRPVPEPDGQALVAASKPPHVNPDAPDSLDAYLVAAASDGRTDAVKKFLSADRNRSYETALSAAIDQAQPQVTNMLVKAGATLPTANTPDARFRLGAVQKALADLLAEEGKPAEAKKYYEQAMALFAAVKPELAAAAESKFKAASEKSGKESFWSTLAQTATKVMASSAAGSQGGGNQAGLAQLLAMKDSGGSFGDLFAKLKTTTTASTNSTSPAAHQEIPKELAALLDSFTNKAALDKTLSDRCDVLIAEIRKKMGQ